MIGLKVQRLCRFEQIGDKDEQVNEYFISRSSDLIILEENIDSEYFECFIDDIISLNILESCTSRTVEFGLDRDDR
jgi:hypothetical protein